VIALGLLLLILGLVNLGKAAMALRYASSLPDLPMTVSWEYLAAVGGFWGVALIVSAVGLAFLRVWGRWTTLAVSTLYEAHVWVNRILFEVSDQARQARPWDLVLTLLFLALVWGLLSRPRIRGVFVRTERDVH
jgi:hypothetical protein